MKIKDHNHSICVQSGPNNDGKHTKIMTRNRSKFNTLKQNTVPNITHCVRSPKKIQNSEQPPLKPIKATQHNPVHEYQKQILKYLQQKQSVHKLKPNYLRNHESLTLHTRGTFIKHFFKVGKKFKLKRNTLYLAVYYMDCYFQKFQQIDKRDAMISALASLWIAMKYQEIYPPELYQWTQPIKQIIQAEAQILKTLNFNLSYNTVQNCLDLYFSKFQISDRDKDMIRLISDVSLFDQNLYKYTASQLSASIFCSIVDRNKLQEKMEMSLKWMIQRNQKYMEWLQELRISKSYL